MPKVLMYSTAVCPYCVRAKQLLQRKGVAYEEVDVSFDATQRLALPARVEDRLQQLRARGLGGGGLECQPADE